MHLSNFRPVKRMTDVIEIFDRVRKKIPSKLLLIGDGPDRSRAEWLAVQKGIHDDVLFLGKQDQVHEKLALADVMLLPSELESFGLAALEAMACEVVPIATRVGGVPEVIEHGKSGFLAEVGDVETMARLRDRSVERRKPIARNGQSGARVGASPASAPPRSFRNMKSFTAGCWSVLRRARPEWNLRSAESGRRKRTSVPFPSWLSMVMRAVSPYSTFSRSATFAMPMPVPPRPVGFSRSCAAPMPTPSSSTSIISGNRSDGCAGKCCRPRSSMRARA